MFPTGSLEEFRLANLPNWSMPHFTKINEKSRRIN